MAVIGTIRNRMGYLLVGIVGLTLTLFILGELLSSNRSMFSSNDVAVVGGDKVSAQDFESRVQKAADAYKQKTGTESVDNAMMDQLREQAWSQMINELIFGKEYEKMGISVSPEELFDMVQGKNIHPQIRQAFTDPNTGQFDPANVVRFLKNLDQQDEKTKTQWLDFEKALKEERQAQKYNNLLSQSLFVTTAEAKQDFIEKNRVAKISFVLKPFSSIADSAVTVSESEMKDYYNAHKYLYKQEEGRKIEYVTYQVLPSESDLQTIEGDLKKLVEEFKTTTNDSAFVAKNAESRLQPAYYKRATIPVVIDTLVFKQSAGFVYGPYNDGLSMKIVKVLGTKTIADSVKARHILLAIDKDTDVIKVKARMDSIKKAIKGGAKFADMAKKFSVDKGSAEKGGDLGTFAENMMVKPFNDACFEGKKGDMPIVETQFGIHLIEILDQKAPSTRVKLAFIDRKLEASSKTFQSVFANANEFAVNAHGDDFEKAVKEKKLEKRDLDLKATDKGLPGVENSREIVRWAFNAKKNETSKVFEIADKYIIASLKETQEKGTAPLEQVKQNIEAMAKREKKAQIITEQFNKVLKSAKDLNTLALMTQGQVQVADAITFNSGGIAGVGREPSVVGTIFTMKAGQMSGVVKGNAGVMVLKVDAFTEPTLSKDFKAEKMMAAGYMKQRASYELYNALKEKANVTDNRIRFY